MTVIPYQTQPQERPWLALQNPALELANAIAGTDFVPGQLRNNPAAITAAILYGDEVGLGPMQSLAKIAVINGRPTLAAEAQRALILHAGHDIWIEEATATRCTMAGRRAGSEATSRVTWTMDDAKRANLAGKQPWRMYPRQMLLARASAELARAVFPDAIGGLAATEELDDEGAALGLAAAPANGGEPADPKPKTARRRRASVTTGPTTTAPPPQPAGPEAPPVPGDEPPPEPAAAAAPEPQPGPTPETPAAEPLTEPQLRRLQLAFRQKGIVDRGDRIAYTNGLIGRDITTSKDLTVTEASELIEHLARYDPDDPQTWPFPEGF